MLGGELARRPRVGGLPERFDLTGDADATVGVAARAARLGDQERGGGSRPVRGPLA
jgi:hypothetical protein